MTTSRKIGASKNLTCGVYTVHINRVFKRIYDNIFLNTLRRFILWSLGFTCGDPWNIQRIPHGSNLHRQK
uniref:Uncharacterized protein n=1 Tax=Cannabis sativa TaxID=3483 RepID=A0A803R7B4_CANSA